MKTPKIINSLMLAVAVLLLLGIAPQWGDAQSGDDFTIEWAPGIMILPAENLKVRRMMPDAIDKEEFISLSNDIIEKVEPNPAFRRMVESDKVLETPGLLTLRNLKISDEKVAASDDLLTAKFFTWAIDDDSSSFITQNTKNGGLLFQNQMRRYINMSQVELPTKLEGMIKAKEFIEDVGILPGDFNVNGKLLATTGLFTQEYRDGVYGKTQQKLTTYYFGRELDGIPVEGLGSRIVIQIGHKGRVVSLIKKWNDIEANLVLTPQLRYLQGDADSAIGNAGAGIVRLASTGGDTPRLSSGGFEMKRETFVVQNEYLSETEVKNRIVQEIETYMVSAELVEVLAIDLVYYDGSGGYIQPAYAVELNIHWEEGEMDYLFHIAALRDPPEAVGFAPFSMDEYAYIPKPLPPPSKAIELDAIKHQHID